MKTLVGAAGPEPRPQYATGGWIPANMIYQPYGCGGLRWEAGEPVGVPWSAGEPVTMPNNNATNNISWTLTTIGETA